MLACLAVEANRPHRREALAAIYRWFTERFDTPDLIEVKHLLAELRTG